MYISYLGTGSASKKHTKAQSKQQPIQRQTAQQQQRQVQQGSGQPEPPGLTKSQSSSMLSVITTTSNDQLQGQLQV